MADPPLHFKNLPGAHGFHLGQQIINLIAGNQYLSNGGDLITRLNPIRDASHTRNRATSPPDSECFPGTREGVILEITAWADGLKLGHWEVESPTSPDEEWWTDSDDRTDWWPDSISTSSFHTCDEEMEDQPHIYWLHGFAGCGKSAISLKIAKIYSDSGRLLASFFFFRGAGDRSTMRRFAVTLASQLAAALPATIPLIEAAVEAEPGLLTNHVSLATQLDCLVLSPFRSVVEQGVVAEVLTNGPFLIVIDGLDECEDKCGVQEFIDHILNFFEEHPTIPLRIFIASRVEQHIRSCLETDRAVLGNLDSHSAESDIERFLEASFASVAKKDRVVKAYVRSRGSWPTKLDMDRLVRHIGGSFVLASTIFKYIVQPPSQEDPTTPMERLPLSLEMNGLDGLYVRTLACSQHLPHFRNIISTIALLKKGLPIVKISATLSIETFEVVRILLNLQAIIHVPGTDEEGDVTLCHTSLRDFLTTESRSGPFFVPPSFHLYLAYYWFSSIIERGNDTDTDHGHDWRALDSHWESFVNSDNCDFLTEIERFKARQPLLVNRVSYHAFLCSMFFCTFPRNRFQLLNKGSNLLTKCAEQLVLAAECADPHTRRWLETGLHFSQPPLQTPAQFFTEHTYEALQPALQHASTAILAKFSGVLEHWSLNPSNGKGKEFVIDYDLRISGTDIFNAVNWIAARARFKWEKLKATPRPPLELSICHKMFYGTEFCFQLDRTESIVVYDDSE